MRNARRWAALGTAASFGVALVAASAAWACIAGPTLNLNPAQVKPGQQVAVSGFNYKGDLPITIRWNALDGPVLGTFQPVAGRFGDPESLVGTVTIPATAKAGSYVLVALQNNPDGTLGQVPVRALVEVTSPGGAPAIGASVTPTETGRAVGLVQTKSHASTVALIFVGLGAALIAGLLAWVLAVAPGRRSAQPEPQPVRVRA